MRLTMTDGAEAATVEADWLADGENIMFMFCADGCGYVVYRKNVSCARALIDSLDYDLRVGLSIAWRIPHLTPRQRARFAVAAAVAKLIYHGVDCCDCQLKSVFDVEAPPPREVEVRARPSELLSPRLWLNARSIYYGVDPTLSAAFVAPPYPKSVERGYFVEEGRAIMYELVDRGNYRVREVEVVEI